VTDDRPDIDIVAMRRRAQASAFADSWSATHVLTWYPRLGRVLAWPVRLLRLTTAGGPRTMAQSLQEYQDDQPPAWALGVDQVWRWNGTDGYRGETGSALCQPLHER
jgi:hypothetical protein